MRGFESRDQPYLVELSKIDREHGGLPVYVNNVFYSDYQMGTRNYIKIGRRREHFKFP